MLYEFKIDNNGDGVEDITYQIRFTTQTRNSDTFLYNTGPIKALDDPNRNFYQTYTLTRIENGRTVLTAGPMLTMPDNVGPASTPSYGGNGSGIYEYTEASGGKGRVFAGQTDEAFFSDLAQAASVVRLTGRVPAGASDITFAYGLAMGRTR